MHEIGSNDLPKNQISRMQNLHNARAFQPRANRTFSLTKPLFIYAADLQNLFKAYGVPCRQHSDNLKIYGHIDKAKIWNPCS